jgi:hypothetical protein
MENPFVYGKVARGESFADREAESEELMADIASGQSVIIFSPRRYGKTSLILEVLDRAREVGLLTVYLDLFKVTSEEGFITTYAKEVAKLQTGGVRFILRNLRELLPRLVPKVVLKSEKAGVEVEFEFDPRSERDPLLDDLLEAVTIMGKKSNKRAVVVFDEFQEIADWDAARNVERQMRSHFQLHQNVSYIFMGSKRHLMQEIFQSKNRPFYRFGKHFPLEKIPRNEFSTFVQKRFGETGVQIAAPLINEILNVTEDHPYYTQLLCHILWGRTHEARTVTTDDVSSALQEVFLREAHAFHDLWDMLPLKARQLLVALAKEENYQVRVYSNDFLQKHNLGSASSVQRAVFRLMTEEILEKVDGGYQYTDAFFKRWIRNELT